MKAREQFQSKTKPLPSFALMKMSVPERPDKYAGGLKRRAINVSPVPDVPPIVHEVLRSPGEPLDPATRAFMEPCFGHDFSRVRVHSDSKSAKSAQTLNALAYTVGDDMVFGSGQYQPTSNTGRNLLAHELTHVIQQNGVTSTDSLKVGSTHDPLEREAENNANQLLNGQSIVLPTSPFHSLLLQRQTLSVTQVKPTPISKPQINYRLAKVRNIEYSKMPTVNNKSTLGWETKLETVAGGEYKPWAELWANGEYDAFADAVAEFQVKQGWIGKSVDGILGLKTWSFIGGLGEAIAGIWNVYLPESEHTCTIATQERIKRGYRLASGKSLELTKEDLSKFNIILQSIPNRMLDVDLQYRGTGAAGAMVYIGKATFVSEADIWAGHLKPGAVLQGWWNQKDFDLLRAGEITEGKQKRRLQDTDISVLAGSSFVFVRYDTDTNERMLIRHMGSTEWVSKSSYAVWVAANI